MANLLSIGRTIMARIRRATRGGTEADAQLFLPRNEAEAQRWARTLGVTPERIPGKLIALAGDARHRTALYGKTQAKQETRPHRRPRNHPRTVGMRSRKNRLKKRGTW